MPTNTFVIAMLKSSQLPQTQVHYQWIPVEVTCLFHLERFWTICFNMATWKIRWTFRLFGKLICIIILFFTSFLLLLYFEWTLYNVQPNFVSFLKIHFTMELVNIIFLSSPSFLEVVFGNSQNHFLSSSSCVTIETSSPTFSIGCPWLVAQVIGMVLFYH